MLIHLYVISLNIDLKFLLCDKELLFIGNTKNYIFIKYGTAVDFNYKKHLYIFKRLITIESKIFQLVYYSCSNFILMILFRVIVPYFGLRE